MFGVTLKDSTVNSSNNYINNSGNTQNNFTLNTLVLPNTFGLFSAVVGVIIPLVQAGIKGYEILEDVQNFGEYWEDLHLRYNFEAVRYTDWTKAMKLQDGDLSVFLEPHSQKCAVVVEILARIVKCFRKIDEFQSTYEPKQLMMQPSNLPESSKQKQKVQTLRKIKSLFKLKKSSLQLPVNYSPGTSSSLALVASIARQRPSESTSGHASFLSAEMFESLPLLG
ncbi:hypothetical protein RUND412_002020 [Rhizina undulata]